MKPENHIAFKEWAVIIHAIAQGKQNIILRKGGIHENMGYFQVEHDEFFLFPTYEHQNETDLKSSIRANLLNLKNPEKEILIEYYVQVKKVFRLKDENKLEAISNFHVWSHEAIRKRFFYGNKQGLYLIVVQAFRLTNPARLANLSKYAGCKSWVDFEQPIATSSTIPIVSDVEIQDFIACLEDRLKEPIH